MEVVLVKKVLLALALLGVFMTGTAFASGHVDPAPFKPIVVVSSDVPTPTGDGGVVSMDLQPAVQGDVPQQGIMELMGSGETAHILSAVKLELTYTNGAGEAVIDLTAVIAKVKAATGQEPTVVWLLNKNTNKVEEFAISGGKITVKPVNAYFTASTLTLGYKTVAGSSSSGGGCNAGFAPAMLLLTLPLALFIRK